MKRLFTKSDLKTGDIVELRNGTPGFVYKDNKCILYSPVEADEFYAFTEDMLRREEDSDKDIVAVYRPGYRQNDYSDYKRFNPVFNRSTGNIFIETNDSDVEEKARIRAILVCSSLRRWSEVSWFPVIGERQKMDLLENPSMDFMNLDHLPFEILPIPGSHGLVILYYPFQETRWHERENEPHKFDDKIRPLLEISETGQQIYSRCLICRQEEDGRLQSIQEEDYSRIMRCLTL